MSTTEPALETAAQAFADATVLLDFVAGQIKSTPSYAGVPLLYAHCARDWRDVLPRVDVPTSVIGCEGSHVNPGSQRFIADQIPGARLHIFPSSAANSHVPCLENPPAVNAVVDKFLSEAPDAGPSVVLP